MTIRFTFRMEAYVEGENLDEIREKYNNILCVLPDGADFVETVSVEDADTYKDMWNEYYGE